MKPLLRAHAPFLALLALLVPAVFHFTASHVIASMGDDSIAYLALARFMLDPGDAVIREWVGYQAHFPPLFPAMLALSGGAWNLQIAHAVVALFAVLAIVLLYRYAAAELHGNAAGLLMVTIFMLTPSAWISLRGILSESMFLCCTLACLCYHRTRLDREGEPRLDDLLVFGGLLGVALLVRSAGATLVAGYVAHALVAAARERRWRGLPRRLLPLLPVALLAALWIAWRPRGQGYNYESVITTILQGLGTDAVGFLRGCLDPMFGGWIRSFTADSSVHWLSKLVFGAVGIAGIAGAALRAWRNHLDGWYALATLPLLFVWHFPEDNTRRLLYPLVPLLLLQAIVFVEFVVRRSRAPPARQRLLLAGAVALPALLCTPAFLLVQYKSLDREQVTPEFRYRYSDMTEYYTTVNLEASRAIAARHGKVLGGLESLRVVSLPGARVMWVRPDYIGILGGRPGVAWYYRWSADDFLREILRSNVEYLVISTLLKSDMDGVEVVEDLRFEWALGIGEVVFSEVNATREGYDVAVVKIDRAALANASRGHSFSSSTAGSHSIPGGSARPR